MNIDIKPEETGGTIYVPPSKSLSHRAIIAASLADGTSKIEHVILSQDIKATIEAVESYGAEVGSVQESEGLFTLMVTGTNDPQAIQCLIDCGESGSTARFLIPILALYAENAVVTGQGRLVKRPLKPFYEIFDDQEFSYESNDGELPLILNGSLKPGEFKLKGDVSSQFLTGLFFALPLLDGDSTVILKTKLESKPYVDLTIKVLEEFGITIEQIDARTFFVPGNQAYRPTKITINGDFSQAAFWFVNGIINKKTVLENLPAHSIQGDFKIIEILNGLGANISYVDKNWVSVPSKIDNFTIDVTDMPDLLPILSVLAGLTQGTSKLTGAKRLKYKESDRLLSTSEMLKSFGVPVEMLDDGLKITGVKEFKGAVIDSFNDHRIAIAAAIASGRADGNVVIEDAHSVNKSYPTFWEDFKKAGGDINGIDVG